MINGTLYIRDARGGRKPIGLRFADLLAEAGEQTNTQQDEQFTTDKRGALFGDTAKCGVAG